MKSDQEWFFREGSIKKSFEQGMAGPVDFCHHRKPAYTDLNAGYNNEITQATPGQSITIELKAALDQDWNKAEKGWVEIQMGNEPAQKLR